MILSTPTKKSLLDFSKYSGCGNDFILIDNRDAAFLYNPTLIQTLCHRQRGIGADGVILLEPSQIAQYNMRIFNADATEAEMCGNGIRCLGRFLQDLEIPGNTFSIEVMQKVYPLSIDPDAISVNLGPPSSIQSSIQLENHLFDLIDTGVPHAVTFVEDLEAIDLHTLGPKIRHHPTLAPKGANVNFCSLNNGDLHIRTYERGVEGETLACGTGAAACALSARQHFALPNPLIVHTQSGEPLSFLIEERHLIMKGPAHFVFCGHFPI